MIPNKLSIMPGEFFPSWVTRSAQTNGTQSTDQFMRDFVFEKRQGWQKRIFHYNDYDFPQFCNAAGIVKGQADLYKTASVYPLMSMFMSRSQQTGYVNSIFLDGSGTLLAFKPEHKPLVSDVHGCPQCMKEDIKTYGFSWYRTIHHLPGVTVCPKHGCALYTIANTPAGPQITSASVESGISSDNKLLQEYAQFAAQLWQAAPDTCIDEIVPVVNAEMCSQGFSKAKNRFLLLPDAMKKEGYASVSAASLHSMIAGAKQLSWKSIPAYIALMIFLFRTANAFLSALGPKEKPAVLQPGYHFIAGSSSLMELEHDNKRIIRTEDGFNSGFLAAADIRTSPEELFHTLLHNAGNGEYEALDPFRSLASVIRIRHACGSIVKISPQRFLYRGIRCQCNYSLSNDALDKRIKSYGDFSLVSRNGENITIRHNSCNQVFTCTIGNFMKFPFCRVCEKKKHEVWTKESFSCEVQNLAGSEYVVKRVYRVNNQSNADLWHRLCEKTFSIKISDFQNGNRCPFCKTQIQNIRAFIDLGSRGRYAFVGYTDKPGYWKITDCRNKATKILKASLVRQELTRPTPSPILPLDGTAPAGAGCLTPEGFYNCLYHTRNEKNLIFKKDLAFPLLTKRIITNRLNLLVKKGWIAHAGYGTYRLLRIPP